jgi:CRP-like cAMP-binding protein
MSLAFHANKLQPGPTLLLLGNWEAAIQHIRYLSGTRYSILLGLNEAGQGTIPTGSVIQLVVLENPRIIEVAKSREIPWIGWMPREDGELSSAAYAAGAMAVLPSTISPEALEQVVRNNSSFHQLPVSQKLDSQAKRRHFQRGTLIPLLADEVMVVEEGIVAQTVIHEDGSEVLLGLYGPPSLLVGHPHDDCFLNLTAHSPVSVTFLPWSIACQSPEFSQQLRVRLRQLEAWTAIQARPSAEDRLLGIFALLAEQFGVEHKAGVVIDVRITHAQLASAVGIARTTVSRLLSQLRRRGRVQLVSIASGERFCLPYAAFSSNGSHKAHLHL